MYNLRLGSLKQEWFSLQLREPFMLKHKKKKKQKKKENLCNIHTFSGVVVAFNLFILKIRKH